MLPILHPAADGNRSHVARRPKRHRLAERGPGREPPPWPPAAPGAGCYLAEDRAPSRPQLGAAPLALLADCPLPAVKEGSIKDKLM